MRGTKAMQNRKELVVTIISIPKLRDCTHITTGCRKNTEMCSKIIKKSHFEIRHYAMPPPVAAQ